MAVIDIAEKLKRFTDSLERCTAAEKAAVARYIFGIDVVTQVTQYYDSPKK